LTELNDGALFDAEFGIGHRGSTVPERSGVALSFRGRPAQVVLTRASATAKLAAVVAGRRAAYAREADPMYLEWQYDGTAEKEKDWRAKVAEIKARFPLPEDK